MAEPTITDYLKYANLQMAAEAFIRDERTLELFGSGDDLANVLVKGNGHASRFTSVEATKFADPDKGWTVLDQRANTTTGFSGTLFQNNETGELVISFRSTEFIDDAVRDNLATNTDEIKNTGWAWGQIADMEKWYSDLQSLKDDEGNLLFAGQRYSVTGYSLGGHLATAFNLLRREDGSQGNIDQVVTFNGAGVGQIGDGSLLDTYAKLPQMVARFQELRVQAAVSDLQGKFTTPEALEAYRAIKAAILANGGNVDATMLGWTVPDDPDYTLSAQAKTEFKLLADALAAAVKIAAEAVRAPSLSSGPDANGDIVIERDGGIEALSGLMMKQGDQNVWVSADGKKSRQRRWAVNDGQRSAA